MQTSENKDLLKRRGDKLFDALEDYLNWQGANDALGYVAGWVVYTAMRSGLDRDSLLTGMHAAFDEPSPDENGHTPMLVGPIRYPKSQPRTTE